jgi:hypothetical protein
MKVRIIVQSIEVNPATDQWVSRHSEVWAGEMDILEPNVYLAKMSLITDGIANPIVDIPFSLGVGHYRWIPPSAEMDVIADLSLHAPEETQEGKRES